MRLANELSSEAPDLVDENIINIYTVYLHTGRFFRENYKTLKTENNSV